MTRVAAALVPFDAEAPCSRPGDPLALAARLAEAGVDVVVAALPADVAGGLPALATPPSSLLEAARAGLALAEAGGAVTALLIQPVDHDAVTDDDLRATVAAAREASGRSSRVVPQWANASGQPIAIVGPGLERLRACDPGATMALAALLRRAGRPHFVRCGASVMTHAPAAPRR